MTEWVLEGLDHEERPVVLIGATRTVLADGEIRTYPFDRSYDAVQWADGSPRMVPINHALHEIHRIAKAQAEGVRDAD